MRKILVICGAILLLSGMASISRSQIIQEKKSLETIAYEMDSWEVSGNFIEGDMLVVDFTPAIWKIRELPDDVIPFPYKLVRIEITSPKNETTVFDITLMWPDEAQLPVVGSINLTEQDGLNTADPIMEVGGIVVDSGQYTARIPGYYGLWPPESDPPSWIAVRKEIVEREYAFTFLLPAGIVLGIVGGVTLLAGIISPRHTRVPIRRKPKPKVSSKRLCTRV